MPLFVEYVCEVDSQPFLHFEEHFSKVQTFRIVREQLMKYFPVNSPFLPSHPTEATAEVAKSSTLAEA